jgi:hypothetical protein
LILPRAEGNQHLHLWPRKAEVYKIENRAPLLPATDGLFRASAGLHFLAEGYLGVSLISAPQGSEPQGSDFSWCASDTEFFSVG